MILVSGYPVWTGVNWSQRGCPISKKYFLQYGRNVARLRRCRRRAYAPASNTARHNNHEKINSWVSFSFLYEYGASLGGPLGLQSFATKWLYQLISAADESSNYRLKCCDVNVVLKYSALINRAGGVFKRFLTEVILWKCIKSDSIEQGQLSVD